MKRIGIIVLAALLLPSLGSAAVLSLDEATQQAVANSPQLDQTRAQAELSKWSHTESLSGFLPTLAVAGHYFFYAQVPTFSANLGGFAISSAPNISPSVDTEITLHIPIFDGFRNVDRFESTKIAYRAAELDVDYGSFSLREQVRLAYFGVIAAMKMAIVAEQDVKDLQDHLSLVQNQLNAGVVRRVDLLRVQTQLSNAISEKTNAEDEIAIRRQGLAQVLGEITEDRELAGELPEPSGDILRAVNEAQPLRRPDIEALGLRTDAADYTHSADAKWWVPSIGLLGSFDALRGDEARISAYVFGLQVSWNVFDGLLSYSRSKESSESERIQHRSEQTAVLQAQTDFQTYKRRYQYNLQKFRAQTEDVQRSEESTRLAKSAFRAGTQTNTDVLDSEQDLFNSRANQIQSQYAALEALIRFELALGRTVTP